MKIILRNILISVILAGIIYASHELFVQLFLKPNMWFWADQVGLLFAIRTAKFVSFCMSGFIIYNIVDFLRIRTTKPVVITEDMAERSNIETIKLLSKLEEMSAEREKLNNELIDKRRMLTCIIDQVPHFIFLKDRAGKFYIANRAVADCYGVHPKALIGKTDADFNAEGMEVFEFRADDIAVIESQTPKLGIIETITCVTGTEMLLTNKYPCQTWDGKQGVLGFSRKITSTVAIKEELLKHCDKKKKIEEYIDNILQWGG